MANKQIVCWRVTVVRPGSGGAQVVLPIARDKLQASKRAAYMLGLSWKESARYMVVRGPIKAQARQIREWNEAYPQWSTEREDPSSASLRSAPSPQGEGFGRGRRIAASASPPRNDERAGEPGRYGGENPSSAPSGHLPPRGKAYEGGGPSRAPAPTTKEG